MWWHPPESPSGEGAQRGGVSRATHQRGGAWNSLPWGTELLVPELECLPGLRGGRNDRGAITLEDMHNRGRLIPMDQYPALLVDNEAEHTQRRLANSCEDLHSMKPRQIPGPDRGLGSNRILKSRTHLRFPSSMPHSPAASHLSTNFLTPVPCQHILRVR